MLVGLRSIILYKYIYIFPKYIPLLWDHEKNSNFLQHQIVLIFFGVFLLRPKRVESQAMSRGVIFPLTTKLNITFKLQEKYLKFFDKKW